MVKVEIKVCCTVDDNIVVKCLHKIMYVYFCMESQRKHSYPSRQILDIFTAFWHAQCSIYRILANILLRLRYIQLIRKRSWRTVKSLWAVRRSGITVYAVSWQLPRTDWQTPPRINTYRPVTTAMHS